MSESESDALPLGYWAITWLILLQLFIFANTLYLLNFINMVDSTMVKITSNFYRIKDKLIDIDQ